MLLEECLFITLREPWQTFWERFLLAGLLLHGEDTVHSAHPGQEVL